MQQPNQQGAACRLVVLDSINSRGLWLQRQFEYLRVHFRHQRQCTGVEFQQDCDSSFTDFHWYFSRPGGGFDTASGASVSHAFPASGRYFVKLKASRPDGYFAWWSDTVLYLQPPVLSSTDTTRHTCRHAQTTYTLSIAQDTVKQGANKLTVNFGDGHDTTFTGNIPSPLTLPHTYRDTGTFSLTAIYTNGFCTDTLILDSVVTVVDAPRPGFALSQNKGCAPLEVTVTDQSEGFVSTWHYAFGTGDSASTASPSYTYEEAGLHWLVQSLLGPSGCLMKDSQQVWVAPGVTAQDTVHMTRVTVTDSGFVQVEWQEEPRVQQYTLVRQPPFPGGNPVITTQTAYLDSLVETSEQSYRYHLTGQDSCGKSTTPSPAHATILLSGKSRGNDLAQLQWSAYQGWPVQRYHLWKGGELDSLKPFAIPTGEAYDDPAFADTKGLQRCYRVQALQQGLGSESWSNLLCLPFQAVVWVPSAFSPNDNDLNERLQAVTIGVEDAELLIYNRWGELLWQGEAWRGWDGYVRGKRSPEGMYSWQFFGRGSQGENLYRFGTVMVVR